MSEQAGSTPAAPTFDVAEAVKGLDAVLGTAPVADTPVVETPVDKGDAETAAPGAVDAKAGEDKGSGDAPPETPVQAQDLSWAPEKLHPLLSKADPEQVEEAKRSFLRWKDYTQKTQSLAAERKEVEALKAAADRWRKLEENPDAAKAAMRVLDGEPAEPEVAAQDEIDLLTADPKTQRAYLEKIAERKAEEMLQKRQAAAQAKEAEMASKADAIRTSVRDWALDAGLTQEEVNEAARKADEFAAEVGLSINEKNVVGLLKRFASPAPAKNTPSSGGAARGLASVAAPGGKGSAAVSPKVVPKHVLEKRGPQTRQEGVEHARMLLRDQFNLDLSNTGLDDFLNSLR